MGSWADRVAELRRAMGVSQERFASLLCVSHNSVNRWEKGRARPEENAALLQLLEIAVARRSPESVLAALGAANGNKLETMRTLLRLGEDEPPVSRTGEDVPPSPPKTAAA